MNSDEQFPRPHEVPDSEEPTTPEEIVADILASWSMSEPTEIRAAVQLLKAASELDTDQVRTLITTGHAIANKKSAAVSPAKKRGRPKKAE